MLYKEIVKKISVGVEKKLKQKEYLKEGLFEVVDQGQSLIGGYSNDSSLVVKCDLPVIIFGDHTKCVKFIDFPFVAGADGVKVLRAKEGVDSKYLYYYTLLLTKKIVDKGYARHYQFLEKMEVDIPSLPEQNRIVNKIEELFFELDSAVETLKKIKGQLSAYRRAVLNCDLTMDNEKWKYVPINEIVEIINSGSTPKSDKMYSSGEIQFIKVYNLAFDGSINLSKDPVFIDKDVHEGLLKRSKVRAGDVLINIVGPPLGKVSIIPDGDQEYNINQAIVMFRPNELVQSKFLAYYLMSPQVVSWLNSTSKATAGQYNVKVSTCREIRFPKVPISEQNQIVKRIETKLAACDDIEKKVNDVLAQAEAMRQSILKKAFEGGL